MERAVERKAGWLNVIDPSRPRLLLLVTLCLIPMVSQSSATQVVLQPLKDNTLYQTAAGSVSNGKGTGLFVGNTNGSVRRRAVLKFNLSDIPPGATVNSVSLTMSMSKTNSLNKTSRTRLHKLLKDWGEGTSLATGDGGQGAPAATGDATWLHTFFNTQVWQSAGGDFSPTASAQVDVVSEGTYTWQSTSQLVGDVQAWVNTPSSNFGWILIGDETTPATAKRFDSREAGATFAPKLTVDYTSSAVDDSPALFFAQFVNGEAVGQLNRSRIILRNNQASSLSGTIRFRDEDGQLKAVPIGGVLRETYDFTLPAWGSLDIETDGTGELFVGSAEVALSAGVSNSDLEGTEIFSLLGNLVSVPGVSDERSWQVYASMNSAEKTGIAFYNPDNDTAAVVELVLLDSNGVEKASVTLTLQPRQQIARFLDEAELFRTYFTNNPGPFKGTVNLNVETGEDIAIVGLIQRLSDGALIAVEASEKSFNAAP